MIINCTVEELKDYLKERLAPKRYLHSLNVADYAAGLALTYGADSEKAYIAGLLHDCGRTMSDEQLVAFAEEEGMIIGEVEMLQPVLLHAGCGAVIAGRYFGVSDREVLAAIENHTTGAADMCMLEKIVYLADILEPERKFDGVKKMRRVAGKSLDEALLLAYDMSVKYVIKTGRLLHQKTVAARNELLIKRGHANGDKEDK